MYCTHSLGKEILYFCLILLSKDSSINNMTQLNDKDRAAQMADMKSFDEEMPSIGIFWYDPNDHILFGVGKKELSQLM